jgi:hypothetical protein
VTKITSVIHRRLYRIECVACTSSLNSSQSTVLPTLYSWGRDRLERMSLVSFYWIPSSVRSLGRSSFLHFLPFLRRRRDQGDTGLGSVVTTFMIRVSGLTTQSRHYQYAIGEARLQLCEIDGLKIDYEALGKASPLVSLPIRCCCSASSGDMKDSAIN